jgi:hypothetical protein
MDVKGIYDKGGEQEKYGREKAKTRGSDELKYKRDYFRGCF